MRGGNQGHSAGYIYLGLALVSHIHKLFQGKIRRGPLLNKFDVRRVIAHLLAHWGLGVRVKLFSNSDS